MDGMPDITQFEQYEEQIYSKNHKIKFISNDFVI